MYDYFCLAVTSGEMEMDTTNRAAYKSYKSMSEVRNAPHGKGGMHAKMGSTVLPVIPMHQGKFYGETQAMRDFPGFGDSQPHPVESIPPAPDNLRVPYHVRYQVHLRTDPGPQVPAVSCSFIQAISKAPLQVHYYSEALPTARILCRRFRRSA